MCIYCMCVIINMSVTLRNWRRDDYPAAAGAAAVKDTHTLFPDHDASGVNSVVVDSSEWRMEKDNLSQTNTAWSVELTLEAAILTLTSASLFLPNELPCYYLLCCCLQSGFKTALKRNRQKYKKTHRDMLYPSDIYITGTIMSRRNRSFAQRFD